MCKHGPLDGLFSSYGPLDLLTYTATFLFVDHVQSIGYATAVNDIQEVKQRAVQSYELICNTPGTFEPLR